MFFDSKKFRVVIIDYPIYALDNTECSEIFGKALSIKHAGYSLTYGENVLPMDKTDFFSTHIMLCEEVNDQLIPIIIYKATPYDRCLHYGIEFPGLSIVKADGHPDCVREIETILSNLDNPNMISFDSSWAQNPEYRFSKDSQLKNCLKEITMMFAVKHHEEFRLPHMMTLGVVKVKTDKFFEQIGLKKLTGPSRFKLKSLNDSDVYIYHNNAFSDEALIMAEKYNELWKNKLVISGQVIQLNRMKAS
jgi:hypothetical protein